VTSNALLVLTTCADAEEAKRLAGALVERRLAACVSTVERVTSTYRWQGKIEHDGESLLLIKTGTERFEALERAIRELSSYDVPEVLAFRVDEGSSAYLDWLAESVRAEQRAES
jgi:periplasmic divalent cation tolerance protein